MRVLPVLLVLTLSVMGSASADPMLFHPGTGIPNPGSAGGRDVIWSEPPDLNGLIGSSEQILRFGLETEIANDFIPSKSLITRETWWGGYFNNTTPCVAGIQTPGFNLEFFTDAGCVPGERIADFSVTDFSEESVGCQAGAYPLFKWSATVRVAVIPNVPYWFCAQIADHPFPPQGGRLASMRVVGCDSMFRSAYFGYPNWTPGDWPFDASQEFEATDGTSGPGGACCFESGSCLFSSAQECIHEGGVWEGVGTTCGPNECAPGACCAPDNTCAITAGYDCVAPNVWQGAWTVCSPTGCALRSPGSITVWGRNDYGQQNVPLPDDHFVALAAGGFHCLALRENGTLVAWGRNDSGQCDVPSPPSTYRGIAAGWGHSLALRHDGSIVAWGLNHDGQCNVPSPNTGFVAVAAGGYHSLALRSDGTIVAWGRDTSGQCDVPAPNGDFVAVAGGGRRSMGLKADGSVVVWGDCGVCSVPNPNADFTAIAAGWSQVLGLKADGSVVDWYDAANQVEVPGPNADFAAIAGGSEHSIGLKRDGSIVVWGSNRYGEGSVPSPNSNFVAISGGGGYDTYALTRFPTVACCLGGGACSMLPEDQCLAAGGSVLRGEASCDSNPCAPTSGSEPFAPSVPAALALNAVPNPSDGRVILRCDLPARAPARVDIIDAAGRIVRRLLLDARPAGRYTIAWDSRADDGRPLPAGVYWMRISSRGESVTGRLVVLGR